MISTPTPDAPPTAAPNAAALPRGARVEGLEIERVLRSSATGVVYLARDQALDLTVALKEYLPAALVVRGTGGQVWLRAPSDAQAFERGHLAFVEQARVLARCDHSSLLRVHRVCHADGTVYCVMPYYVGKNLLAVRQGMRGAADEEALCALLDALLGALETLHHAGRNHGDVTPENILLLADDRPVLMGFGAVRRALAAVSAQATPAAEPARAAPAAGHTAAANDASPAALDPSTDLRALAAVARFCLSGKAPAASAAAHDQVLRELPDRLYCGQALHDTIEALGAARPGSALHRAAQCRALLRAQSARVSSRMAALPNPAVPTPPQVAKQVPEPGLTNEGFFEQLDQTIADAARQTRLGSRATPPPRPTAKAAPPQLAPRPRPPRALGWVSAVVLIASVGSAAVWGLNERKVVRVPQQLAAAAATVAEVAQQPPQSPQETHATQATQPEPALPAPQTPASLAPPPPPAPSTERVEAPEPQVTAKPPAPLPRPVAKANGSPREECGARTEFALYRCMKLACAAASWQAHAQCVRLRETDEVD